MRIATLQWTLIMRGKLTSIRIKNFKAVADSKSLKLAPLTVFIGNNGTGKSSVIEALQTIYRLVTDGLDGAMQAFKGMEHVRHKRVTERARLTGSAAKATFLHPIEIKVRGRVEIGVSENQSLFYFRSQTRLNATADGDHYFVDIDDTELGEKPIIRKKDVVKRGHPVEAKELRSTLGGFVRAWQFLTLDPARMGSPVPVRRAAEILLLEPDGSNLADYLRHLVLDYAEEGTAAWKGIVQALQFVLPYAEDVQPQHLNMA